MIIFRSPALYLSILGLALALFLIKKTSSQEAPLPPSTEPAVNPYEQTIAASGLVEALDKNIAIGVPQSGLVKTVFVKAGESVNLHQPLFQIDDRELQAQLLVQQAQVKVAETTLQRLQSQLQRLNDVTDKRAISQEELDTRAHDVKVARAQLDATQAQVNQTKMLIERLTVHSPIKGSVLQSNIRAGEYALSSASIPAMIIGNIERLQVRADVDEQNASYIVTNLKATAFPKNNAQLNIPLCFERIEPYVIPKKSLTGASDERVDTRVLQVIYSCDYPKDFPLYVGQQVDVFIEKTPTQAQVSKVE
jgi:RND family efflux transporter MFP subunit